MPAESRNPVKLTYAITKATQERLFVEQGGSPSRERSLEVDSSTLSREDRQLLLVIGGLSATITLTIPAWTAFSGKRTDFESDRVFESAPDLLTAFRTAYVAAQATFARDRDASLTKQIGLLNENQGNSHRPRLDLSDYNGSSLLDAAKAALDAALARYDAMQTRLKADQERREQAERDAKTQRQIERNAWIAQHGSAYLKKCADMGYDCQKAYVHERAALEHPAYVLDYNDDARWKDRAGPREAALDEAARVGGQIVWLTYLNDADDFFEPCEAVVIRSYLGKYDLIRTM